MCKLLFWDLQVTDSINLQGSVTSMLAARCHIHTLYMSYLADQLESRKTNTKYMSTTLIVQAWSHGTHVDMCTNRSAQSWYPYLAGCSR